MTRRRLALLMLVVVSLTGRPGHSSERSPGENLQGLLDDFCAQYGFPGATAAVVFANGETISAATGFADLEARTPMTSASRMLAASIGKTFVAATVLALAMEGELDLDGRVADYLGDRDWFVRLPNQAAMTIAHLLQHASGLPDHVHTLGFSRAMAERVANGDGALRPEESIAFVLDAAPLFPPGQGWAYTDTGYLLLGLIIEKVTNQSYYEEITQRFLRPLGLADTMPANRRALPGLVVGYTPADNSFGIPARTADQAGRLLWDPATEWTGGGLVSTSRDLAEWGHQLFTGAALSKPCLAVLLKSTAVAPDTPDQRYGAGVAILENTPYGTVYGHGGWIPGYVSSLRHYANHDVTIAFQINTDVGIVDDSSDLVPVLEKALAAFAIDSEDE